MSRRLLAPEVVQTSSMDCGPAALKCLLEGFGVPVSYGRLREACQTDVDGTSIDTLEDVAVQLGLDAEQVVVPRDHVARSASRCLPAIVVVAQPNGMTHFVVAWRRLGPWLQVMDPAVGRHWVRIRDFEQSVYGHTMAVTADDWREFAGTDDFVLPLRERLEELGLRHGEVEGLLEDAVSDAGWRGLAALDAATRLTGSLVGSGALRSGREASGALSALLARAAADEGAAAIPAPWWIVRPLPPQDGEAMLAYRGAVLVRVLGRHAADVEDESRGSLSPELAAALAEPVVHPAVALVRLLLADGRLRPALVTAGVALAGGGVMLEAVVFRALFEVGALLKPVEQRVVTAAAVVALALVLLLLELGVATASLRMGRHLEARLRVAFLAKIPRLADRYFHSRPSSDMAERGHAVHTIRHLPGLGTAVLRAAFGLAFTTVGLVWLDPLAAPLALAAAFVSVVVPLAVQPLLAERDLRQRTHRGGLTRLYLDAFLGLVAIRTHRAERALRSEHEQLLTDWAHASDELQRAVVVAEALQAAVGLVLSLSLVAFHALRHEPGGGMLLLVWWSLQLPLLGRSLAVAARQYPAQRSITLRLLEPLGATEEGVAEAPEPGQVPEGPVSLRLEGVGVVAGGHTILDGIDLEVGAGEHVAIVGSSGAGKSSLVGLLLGWHRPSRGRVLVDGARLDGPGLAALRRRTAWIDPEVRLWNRSLLDNLLYGNDADGNPHPGAALEAADLQDVLETLPDGLQTELGEAGGLLSGGQGQRVRTGRALIRQNVGLVLLDEAFRGLDREQRRKLLTRVREWWEGATLLCITHDVSDTRHLPRVVVVEGGRIVEDGAPAELLARPGGAYRALVDAEEDVRRRMWAGARWRRWWMGDGRLQERP